CPLVVAVAVREIDARDVEAALHHAGEALGIVGGRSQRGDDLRAAMQALHGTNYRIVTAHTEPGTPGARSAAAALLQDRDGRELLALHELEESAAAGGDVGNAGGDPVLVDGGQRVPAAREREGVTGGDRHGNRPRALPEGIVLENPDRPKIGRAHV